MKRKLLLILQAISVGRVRSLSSHCVCEVMFCNKNPISSHPDLLRVDMHTVLVAFTGFSHAPVHEHWVAPTHPRLQRQERLSMLGRTFPNNWKTHFSYLNNNFVDTNRSGKIVNRSIQHCGMSRRPRLTRVHWKEVQLFTMLGRSSTSWWRRTSLTSTSRLGVPRFVPFAASAVKARRPHTFLC